MPEAVRKTERIDPDARDIDARPTREMLSLLLSSQMRAGAAVEAALPAIAQAIDLALGRLSGGGRLVYLAAGSPAMLALGDALEIPQTYGEDPARFRTVLAGGDDIVRNLAGGTEDDRVAGRADILAASVGPLDCVLAISASGSTPYVLEGLLAARETGAATVAIANNAGAPLFAHADVAILLDTGPEIIAGSTRMSAGTAQKIALNMISTALCVRRGHVHDGMMVGLRADNEKLRERARRMVEDIAAVSAEAADRALAAATGEVKTAVLLARGATAPDEARDLLEEKGWNLRQALARLAG